MIAGGARNPGSATTVWPREGNLVKAQTNPLASSFAVFDGRMRELPHKVPNPGVVIGVVAGVRADERAGAAGFGRTPRSDPFFFRASVSHCCIREKYRRGARRSALRKVVVRRTDEGRICRNAG